MNEPVLHRINSLMQLRQEVEALDENAPWMPPADIVETDTELLIILDTPGTLVDALELEEDGGNITIRGSRPDLTPEGHTLTSERPRGNFSRTFMLPVETIPGSGHATLSAGVLVVRLEKRHKTIDHE